MAEEEERVYTIPLGRTVWAVPRTQRAPRAVRAVREFVRRHLKARAEDVWVDPKLNEILWARGRQRPPRRIQVRVIKLEDETVEVSPLREEETEGGEGGASGEEAAEEPAAGAAGEAAEAPGGEKGPAGDTGTGAGGAAGRGKGRRGGEEGGAGRRQEGRKGRGKREG